MMPWVSKIVALFAVALVAGNSQCLAACASEHCRPAEAPPSHCHQKSAPDKEQPTSAPCSHDITIVDTSAKTITAAPEQALVATYNIPLVAEAPRYSFHTWVIADISPPTLSLSSISVLRI
jgi:hypothetical protein